MFLHQYLLVQNHQSLGLKSSCLEIITGFIIFVGSIYVHRYFVVWQQFNSYSDHYFGP
jgi:hypothetical protein